MGISGRSHWTMASSRGATPREPGTHFRYNTPATYMLSAIVQKVTDETVLDYLTPRLFEPLGIEKPQWDTSPQDISIGGYGLFLRTEDIAKFGQLYGNLIQTFRSDQIAVHQPELPKMEWIELVHEPNFVQDYYFGTLDPQAQRRIGLPWSEALVTRTLTAVGGTILTARRTSQVFRRLCRT